MIERQAATIRRLAELDLGPSAATVAAARTVVLVGTGTSHHAAELGAMLLGAAGCHARAVSAAHYARWQPPAGPEDALVVISHTATTAFSVRARLEALQAGVRDVYRTGDETKSIEVDAAFFAVGWPSNADVVDAAAAGVTIERGYVVVDDELRTSVPHIFAAGDVGGHSMLVSSAILEGRVAAENAVLGAHRQRTHAIVPVGSFTDPEYGSVGLTEKQARAQYECAVAVARHEDLLRPVADGQPEGFCKLIVETEQRRIVGAHVLGEYSAEVIQMIAACMAAGMRVEEVAELQFAFPTFTEGVSQAARMIVRELAVRPMHRHWSSLSVPQGMR